MTVDVTLLISVKCLVATELMSEKRAFTSVLLCKKKTYLLLLYPCTFNMIDTRAMLEKSNQNRDMYILAVNTPSEEENVYSLCQKED